MSFAAGVSLKVALKRSADTELQCLLTAELRT
jgi:hypothetical protein